MLLGWEHVKLSINNWHCDQCDTFYAINTLTFHLLWPITGPGHHVIFVMPVFLLATQSDGSPSLDPSTCQKDFQLLGTFGNLAASRRTRRAYSFGFSFLLLIHFLLKNLTHLLSCPRHKPPLFILTYCEQCQSGEKHIFQVWGVRVGVYCCIIPYVPLYFCGYESVWVIVMNHVLNCRYINALNWTEINTELYSKI